MRDQGSLTAVPGLDQVKEIGEVSGATHKKSLSTFTSEDPDREGWEAIREIFDLS